MLDATCSDDEHDCGQNLNPSAGGTSRSTTAANGGRKTTFSLGFPILQGISATGEFLHRVPQRRPEGAQQLWCETPAGSRGVVSNREGRVPEV